MKLINEITLDNNSKTQEITDYLNEFGVSVINEFISEETINSLKLEFEELQMCNQPWALKTEYSKGRCCRVNRLEMTSKNFPTTAGVFGSKWMENICNRYLGDESLLNHDIFLVHDVRTSVHIAQDLHYDKIPTLKFFIYLTDTTSENGSFYCVPGSHKYTKKLQDKNRIELKSPEHSETRFVPLEFQSEQIPLEGKAGTLIIFDTDVFHRAGKVDKGERFVMRGHSREKKFIPGYTNHEANSFLDKFSSFLKNKFWII